MIWVLILIVEPTRRRGEENRSPDVEPVDEEQDIQVSYLSKLSPEAACHNSSSDVRMEWYGGDFGPWTENPL